MKNNAMSFEARILRSPYSIPIMHDKGGRAILTSLKTHPENWLKRLAAEGFNGIWLNALFRELVPSPLFPRVNSRVLDCLNRLIERAGRHGVKVYLYLMEPRALPVKDDFWKSHPGLRGQPWSFNQVNPTPDETSYALCSSTPEVREYLESSAYNLFKRAPGLGGVLLVTASEANTHCYSHYPLPQKHFSEPDMAKWAAAKFVCPRCARRSRAEVVAEIISLVYRGARRAAPDARVMAHTWSWYIIDPEPQRRLIGLLPKGVILFSDWERGGKIKVMGRTYPVDEYAYVYTGPAPRFVSQSRQAAGRGMRIYAKISINATHELRSVPYLPLAHILAEKMRRMRALGVAGFEGSMPFGAEMTPMTRLAAIMSRRRQPDPADALAELAEGEFGTDHSEAVIRAWRLFARAWRHYPFSIPLLYWGPLNYATAWPFARELKKAGRIASWRGLPRDKEGRIMAGDNLETWVKPFAPLTVAAAFRLMHADWVQGVKLLDLECARSGSENRALLLERNLAEHVGLSFGSAINIIRFCLLCRRLKINKSPGKKRKIQKELAIIARREIASGLRDIELLKFDPRLGYHPEAHEHQFTVEDLKYKIARCREIAGRYDAAR
ncbi:MAG: hypothetical protein WC299_01400 [Kiritimatiellia bacterium]